MSMQGSKYGVMPPPSEPEPAKVDPMVQLLARLELLEARVAELEEKSTRKPAAKQADK